MTEKSMGQVARNRYTFAVPVLMDKTQVKTEVEKLYGVKVAGVATVRMHGKMHRTGKKGRSAKAADWKKAIVTIKSGEKTGELATLFEVSGEAK